MKVDESRQAPIAAAKMPVAVRVRLRIVLRRTIRQSAVSRRQNQPMRSSTILWPRRGGLGRIASAGLSRNTARAPRRLPTTAQARLIASPPKSTLG